MWTTLAVKELMISLSEINFRVYNDKFFFGGEHVVEKQLASFI